MHDKISERRLERIKEIINNYDCSKPLHFFLKEYFRKNPVMGSTDRRIAGTAVYNYYRTGKALLNKNTTEKISISSFLFGTYTSPFIDYLLRNYSFFPQDEITFPLARKMELVRLKNPDFSPESIFPFKEHVSTQINFEKYVESLLIQPRVWIRIKIEYIENVKKELAEKNIVFETTELLPNALGLENNVQLQQLKSFENGYFEVQDLSSQRTGDYMKAVAGEEWWDCCAGAGGKSLMLKEKYPDIKLFATDVRENILVNLEQRFVKAGIKNYSTQVINLENEDLETSKLFDGIICDVPCSGSGTFGRAPENIFCFEEEKINYFQHKQKTIVSQAAKHLKKNGKLIYITCSVFKAENEDVVDFIQKNCKLKLLQINLIDGTQLRADSLFVAVLER